MASSIQIQDGNPWWMSPDIWVVPGKDPNGTTGIPIAGKENYVWAKVHNIGIEPIVGAKVNFYWSNPAMGVLRSNSTLIGQAFVDLDSKESKDVLCLTPWIPTVVNNGHECIVVEAISNLTTLPNPPQDAFDPQIFDYIAQRNIQVIIFSPIMQFLFLPIQISASDRIPKKGTISVESGLLDTKHERIILSQFGFIQGKIQRLKENTFKYGISKFGGCHNSRESIDKHRLDFKLDENTSTSIFLHIEHVSKSKEMGYQILNLVERVDGKVVGGNSVLIIKQ
ncbi:MAG: hypothetical protein MUC49_21085 [Raineya sp.]|jgi:hypothetical protein|nr:hypothetical protein [Raineya sp.]